MSIPSQALEEPVPSRESRVSDLRQSPTLPMAAGIFQPGGGNPPRWSRDGRELFYRKGDRLFSVKLQTQPYFRADRPKLLFSTAFSYQERYDYFPPDYDVSPDGQTFLIEDLDSFALSGSTWTTVGLA